MVYNVAKTTPFGLSILPTPILLLSISKAGTTSTAYNTDGVNRNGEIVDNLNVNESVVISTEIVSTEKAISDNPTTIASEMKEDEDSVVPSSVP